MNMQGRRILEAAVNALDERIDSLTKEDFDRMSNRTINALINNFNRSGVRTPGEAQEESYKRYCHQLIRSDLNELRGMGRKTLGEIDRLLGTMLSEDSRRPRCPHCNQVLR